jgi:hypothetical protein
MHAALSRATSTASGSCWFTPDARAVTLATTPGRATRRWLVG